MTSDIPGSGEKHDRRSFLQAVGTAGIAATIAGCMGDESGDNGGNSGTLRVAYETALTGLDPHNVSSVVSWNAVYNICETLVTFEDGEIVGEIAEDWSVDGLVYTFQIREGIQFHPPVSRELTAEDVAYSINRMRTDDAATDDIRNNVARADATDEYEVEIELEDSFGPFLPFLARPNFVIVPEEAVSEQGGTIGDFQKPVGTGPFVFEEHEQGDFFRLSAFDDYRHEEYPYVEEVEVTITPDEDSRSLAVRNDDVDFARNIPYRDVESVQNEAGTKVTFNEGTQWAQIHLNCSHEPWDNPAVRRAVAHVFDREAVIETALSGFGTPAWQPYPEGNFWHFDGLENSRERDPDRAQEILDEAGNPLEDETLTIKTTSAFPVMEATAEILQANLTEVGIDAEINNLEWGTLLDDFLERNYGAMAFAVPFKEDPDRHYFGFLEEDGHNQYGQDQPDVDRIRELIVEGRRELDQSVRADIYRELEELVQEHVPWISVSHAPDVTGLRENVSGVETWFLPYDRYWKIRKEE